MKSLRLPALVLAALLPIGCAAPANSKYGPPKPAATTPASVSETPATLPPAATRSGNGGNTVPTVNKEVAPYTAGVSVDTLPRVQMKDHQEYHVAIKIKGLPWHTCFIGEEGDQTWYTGFWMKEMKPGSIIDPMVYAKMEAKVAKEDAMRPPYSGMKKIGPGVWLNENSIARVAAYQRGLLAKDSLVPGQP
ncbi:MAG: hypothetical protein RJB39_736 [Candidatus Parcubacteria bacterium]